MFGRGDSGETKAEQLARELFNEHFTGDEDDTAIGDALRASLADVVDYVIRQMGAQMAWIDGEGFPDYPYTNEALQQVEAVTS